MEHETTSPHSTTADDRSATDPISIGGEDLSAESASPAAKPGPSSSSENDDAMSGEPRSSQSDANGEAASAESSSIDIILASASPRRKDLLEAAGVRFRVHTADVDETLDADMLADPAEAAKKLAEKKAGAVVQEVLAADYVGTMVVIGADTMVVLDQEIFGKPRSVSEATGMLRKLSGRTHQVVTGVSLWMVMAPEAEKVSLGFRSFCETSQVVFKQLDDDAIATYLRQGESFDKAGAYAAQGEGAKLIERIEGDLDTVIGLPVAKLLQEFPDLVSEPSS